MSALAAAVRWRAQDLPPHADDRKRLLPPSGRRRGDGNDKGQRADGRDKASDLGVSVDAVARAIETMLGKLAGHPAFQGAAAERLKMCGDCRVIDLHTNPNEVRITDL